MKTSPFSKTPLELLSQLKTPNPVPAIIAARAAPPGTPLESILNTVAVRNDASEPTPRLRRRIAGLVVGEVAEREFQRRYTAAMRGQEFAFEDERGAATETDFLVLNGRGRRAFRINIKAHGTYFREAERFVGLAPEDTFALATYKIRDSNRRSAAEALPFLFAIVSSPELAADPIAETLPQAGALLLDVLTLYKSVSGMRAIENALVQLLIVTPDPANGLVARLSEAVRAANWRVISAVKAEFLMNTLMWERVPALAKRNFAGNRESQANMHFSLSQGMIDLDDFLELLKDHGLQHVATKIAYHLI